jgi:hypothetical protein
MYLGESLKLHNECCNIHLHTNICQACFIPCAFWRTPGKASLRLTLPFPCITVTVSVWYQSSTVLQLYDLAI